MRDYVEVFKKNQEVDQKCIEQAFACLDRFCEAFEKEDKDGMDECCHFPHYLLSGSEVICWQERGQLTTDFFEKLKESGFKRTVVTKREPILICKDKVHFLYSYDREDRDGNVMSKHDNLWILTCIDNKWGIQVRSY